MTSGGFHYLSQEVITRPFALTHPWDISPTTTMTVHGTMNPELKDYSCHSTSRVAFFFFFVKPFPFYTIVPRNGVFFFFPPPLQICSVNAAAVHLYQPF